MLTMTPYFAYAEFDTAIRFKAEEIREVFQPDVIVAISRGGMIAAQMLAYQMEVENVRLLDIGRIGGAGAGKHGDDIVLRSPFVMEGKFDKVLIVDDICCKGSTIEWLRQNAGSMFHRGSIPPEIQYFTVVTREHSRHLTEFSIYTCDNDDFIAFPWDFDHTYRTVAQQRRDDVDDIPF